MDSTNDQILWMSRSSWAGVTNLFKTSNFMQSRHLLYKLYIQTSQWSGKNVWKESDMYITWHAWNIKTRSKTRPRGYTGWWRPKQNRSLSEFWSLILQSKWHSNGTGYDTFCLLVFIFVPFYPLVDKNPLVQLIPLFKLTSDLSFSLSFCRPL